MRLEFEWLNIGPTQSPITVRVAMFKLKNTGVNTISAAFFNLCVPIRTWYLIHQKIVIILKMC